MSYRASRGLPSRSSLANPGAHLDASGDNKITAQKFCGAIYSAHWLKVYNWFAGKIDHECELAPGHPGAHACGCSGIELRWNTYDELKGGETMAEENGKKTFFNVLGMSDEFRKWDKETSEMNTNPGEGMNDKGWKDMVAIQARIWELRFQAATAQQLTNLVTELRAMNERLSGGEKKS